VPDEVVSVVDCFLLEVCLKVLVKLDVVVLYVCKGKI
jgi:hypothetical protein